MSFYHGPTIVTNGLVFSLDAADRNSYPGSGTTWRDTSGNANNGTLTNGPTFDSTNGGVISFDGQNDYVSTAVSGMSVGTMYSWLYPLTSPNGGYYEGVVDNDVGGEFGQGMGLNNGTFQTLLDNTFWDPSTSVSVGAWQQIALSWNSTTAKFYKNGINTSTLSYTQGAVNTANFDIGRSRQNSRYVNGYIPIVMIYNRVLTDLEILQNYDATKSRFGLT